MFNIEYVSGLEVCITVTVSPGAGESWISNDPTISWGDGLSKINVTNGTHYHTYASYGTYTIGLDGENTCGGTAGDEESITLIEPVTCDGQCPRFNGTGCDLLNHYDANDDGTIDHVVEYQHAVDDYHAEIITLEELHFVMNASDAGYGGINEMCPGCYRSCPLPICSFMIN